MNRPRAELEEKLNRGMSVGVMVNGTQVVINNIKDLPSEAELAQGDPNREAQARADLIRRRAELDAQEALLNGSVAASSGQPADTSDLSPEGGSGNQTPPATNPPADDANLTPAQRAAKKKKQEEEAAAAAASNNGQ